MNPLAYARGSDQSHESHQSHELSLDRQGVVFGRWR
jgi:hypothetical protein